MNVVLAHPGTQCAFRLASELNRSNALSRFVTCFAMAGDSFLARLFKSKLNRRIFNDILPGKIKTYPELSLFELLMRALQFDAEKMYFQPKSKFQASGILYELD